MQDNYALLAAVLSSLGPVGLSALVILVLVILYFAYFRNFIEGLKTPTVQNKSEAILLAIAESSAETRKATELSAAAFQENLNQFRKATNDTAEMVTILRRIEGKIETFAAVEAALRQRGKS